MDTQRICPGCQKPLAPDAPQGLCPECLLKAGFGTAGGGSGAQPAFAPPTVETVARLFPQLQILGFIGQGGMGAVYKARQPGLDRLVALKILPPRTGPDPGFAERFTREARALARLTHPNIVAVYDFGQVDFPLPAGAGKGEGLHYFIMEYVDGLNLRQLEEGGKLSPRQALSIIPQICEALQFAHDEGIVHRDIKPENVLIDKKGRARIADFGLARIVDLEPTSTRLTGARDVMGTPHYMAPEQVERPREVDHRADIYSLGVVFYEMLTGELPLGRFAPPSQKAQIDVRLDEVVLRALEKEPERRYQHASEVKTDVESISASPAAAAATGPQRADPNLQHLRQSLRQFKGLRRFKWRRALIAIFLVSTASFLALRSWYRPPATFPLGVVVFSKAFGISDAPISHDFVPASPGWMVSCANTQTFRLYEVPLRNLDQCVLVYRARLKSEGLNGRAYLEMWVHAPGGGEFFSRGLDNTISGANDWSTCTTPFFLRKGDRVDRARLNLVVEGEGRVFIDDIQLSASRNPQ